jgi:hypothetical protein
VLDRTGRIVDELVAAGLVGKQTNLDHGHPTFAVLTADGLARYRAAAPVYPTATVNEFGGSPFRCQAGRLGCAAEGRHLADHARPRRLRSSRRLRGESESMEAA